MDYKHWCQFLSDDEFELWDHYGSFREFIYGSFTWCDTKQGHDYWRRIAHRDV